MKTYILQKDCLHIKAGTEFGITVNNDYYASYEGGILFLKDTVENTPELFKEKEEVAVFNRYFFDKEKDIYINEMTIESHFCFRNEQLVQIREFIKSIMPSEGYCMEYENKYKAPPQKFATQSPVSVSEERLSKHDLKWTDEDMRKCFYAPIRWRDGNYNFDHFEDYLKSLNK